MKTLDARTIERWRAWLDRHHASASEIWLIYHKKYTGNASLAYLDAVDEALCYGWIDSLVRRIDDARYTRKFTPRKPGSKWSAINRKRYAALEAAGRLAPAGKARSPKGAAVARRPNIAVPAKLPTYIARAFKSVPAAWEYFRTLAPSHQKHYMMWIHMAKQQQTKERRLAEAIRLLSKKQKLGLK
jgi:uncharacterized protein YdeI (YjbR/CyaY-like superfamily)